MTEISRHEIYTGNTYINAWKQLPEGTIPLDSVGLMRAITGLDNIGIWIEDFLDPALDTPDGIAIAGTGSEYSGRFRLDLGSTLLRAFVGAEQSRTPQSKKLLIGALQIASQDYENIPGPEFEVVKIGDEKFAVLVGDNRSSYDSVEGLFELGATRLGKPNERGGGYLLLAVCGYDFEKRIDHPENQAAIDLSAAYEETIREKTQERHGAYEGLIFSISEPHKEPTLQQLFLGSLRRANLPDFSTGHLEAGSNLVGIAGPERTQEEPPAEASSGEPETLVGKIRKWARI